VAISDRKFGNLEFLTPEMGPIGSLENLCNDYQPDALFILNLFCQPTCTCFGHVYCPSSGGINCIRTEIGTCYTFKLTGSWPGQDGTGSVCSEYHLNM
jgi:hypothetical protein